MEQLGYSLINKSNTEVEFWGNTPGQVPGMPSMVILPTEASVHNPIINQPLIDGYKIVYRYVIEQKPSEFAYKSGETISFDGANTVVTYDYTTPDVQDLRLLYKQKVASIRYDKEIGGVMVANNTYSTDRESQTKYVAVAVDISQSDSNTWSIMWKTANNTFVNLNAVEMGNVIGSVRSYVQSCFNKESEYINFIDSANTDVLITTDFNADWPSQNY